jgi:hypothetical protein
MKFLIVTALLITNLYANTRVDGVISEDAMTRLNTIENLRQNLNASNVELKSFEKKLEAASKVASREKVFVVIRNTALVAAAISLAATGSLLYNVAVAKSEGSLYSLLAAYGTGAIAGGTAVVAAGAEVGVYFSKNEASSLGKQIKELQGMISSKQKDLSLEVNLLCKDEPRHKLCY